MLMMLPPRPAAIICAPAARASRNALVRSTSITRSQSSSLYSAAGARRMRPALLTRMSSRPNVRHDVSSTSRPDTARSPRSPVTLVARRPSRFDRAPRCRPGIGELPWTATIRARFRERDRHRRAEPGGRAGHERDLTVQPEGVETAGRGSAHGTRNSSRIGVKMSISTTSSSSIVAPCATFGGKCRTSPAPTTSCCRRS